MKKEATAVSTKVSWHTSKIVDAVDTHVLSWTGVFSGGEAG